MSKFYWQQKWSNTVSLCKKTHRNAISNKKSTLSISTTLSGVILHARLFVTGQLQNPWQTLAEPLGSAEPRLKNTGLEVTHWTTSVMGMCRTRSSSVCISTVQPIRARQSEIVVVWMRSIPSRRNQACGLSFTMNTMSAKHAHMQHDINSAFYPLEVNKQRVVCPSHWIWCLLNTHNWHHGTL